MQIRPLGLNGVFEICPRKFGDDRGFFSEIYNAKAFTEAGIDLNFVQDNHSFSAAKGVVRGLHYQLPPFAQDKLVRVTRGAILDVAVDIRKSSPTFGKWVALEVSAEKWNQILVPKGFAHGFMTLIENTEVIYKVTNYYSPEHDRSIRFDDPAIGIDWPTASSGVQLSDKDQKAPLFADAEVFA
ncbi:dTDP-4-dehydrorhamnose 3,5-epimerase [Ochrobactrum sp. CGA5]|uniref:dTDP-4-dehydrorhamnose 3,5-epimerase n=1 Tax=Ochrobactrum sp. CGA5 TaxID=2583453 RepID=UPI0011204625|nr:dTDP-4-dehydrorhamnose 3,5-epimerase [Ochrobactrum sp. CGA5]